ncbi:MAG TPA: hypothetical protein PKI28_07990 [Accumulibacter sp.]|nr:hypothetical protein [Accumulibacter sp.]
MLRGGSWFGRGRYVRSANRVRDEPGYRNDYIGFRLALGPSKQVGSPAEPVTGKGLAAEPTTQRSRTAPPSSSAPSRTKRSSRPNKPKK